MDVNIENISKLQNDSSYYLSDSGEIKKSGLLTKIKCFFNIGHSRERVSNLVNAIKNTLVNSTGGRGEADLTKEIKNIDIKRGIEGSVIKEFAQNFRAKNKDSIIKYQAERTAKELVNHAIDDLDVNSSSKVKKSDSLRKLLLQAVCKDYKNPPIRQNDGHDEVDLVKLKIAVNSKLNSISRSLVDISRSDTLGCPDITGDYVDYLKDVLLAGDKPVDDLDISKLKSPDDAFSERIINDICEKKPEQIDSCKQAVELIIRECKAAPDLRDILMDNARSIIERGNSIRTLQSIQEKVDAIKGNLNDFRTLSLTNPQMLEYGKSVLNQAKGKSISPGFINSLFEYISSADLSVISKINSKSSASEIQKAVLKLNSILQNAFDGKTVINFEEQDDKSLYRGMVFGMLALRLSPEQRQSLRQAFDGVEYSKLYTLYDELGESLKKSKNFPNHVALLHNQIAFDINVTVGDIRNTLCLMTGKDLHEQKEYVGQIDSNLKQTVEKDIISISKNEAEKRIDSYFKKHYSGEKTEFVKSYLKDSMLNANLPKTSRMFDVPELFSLLVKKDVHNFLNLHFLRSMKKLTGDNPIEASFFKDLGRQEVILPGGKKLNKDDPQIALNELSEFVIGRENAKFSELSDAEKNKVRVVMSLLTQDTGKALTDGVPIALDKNKPQNFAFVVNKEDYTFNLVKTKSGDITVECKYKGEPNTLVTEQGDTTLNQGSSVEGYLSFVLRPEEIERLAGLDYKSLDFTESEKILNGEDQEHQGDNAHNRLQKSMDTLPNSFIINTSPTSRYSLDLKSNTLG